MKKNKILLSGIALSSLLFSCGSDTSTKEEVKEISSVKSFDTEMLNKGEKPCNDFYEYSIGSWLKNNPIPASESRWGSFEYLSEENKKKIRSLIENIVAEENLKVGSEKQQIRDLYKSSIDSVNRENIGLEPLKNSLKTIEDIKNKEQLFDYLIASKKNGLGVSTFGFYIDVDSKNSEAYALYLSQGGLSLPDKDYYLSDKKEMADVREKYKVFMNNMMNIIGVDNVDEKVQDIYNLEYKLAEVCMDRVKRRNPDNTYNKLTLEELNSLAPEINWEKYFSSFAIKNVDFVLVRQPNFIKNWSKFYKSESLETWKNYLSWKLIDASASYLTDELAKENFNFYSTVLNGVKVRKAPWKRSQALVNSLLGEPLGKVYVENYFSEDSKKDISNLIENLRSAFRVRIDKLTWMSEDTKKQALKKLNSFTYKIGYTDKWDDFSSIKISPNNLYSNVQEVRKFSFNKMLKDFGKSVDKTRWLMNPQTINAYYHPLYNEVVFPAAILQPPFYSPDADAAINYGAIGAVIGHEFTHGFDDQGCKFNHVGNFENWWTKEDKSSFDDRANVIVDQFNNYEVLPSLNVNGKLTLGENIADLGGLTLAYYALEKEFEGKEKPADIDGFSYKQRLFLGWANVWKNNINEAALRNRIQNDTHSPGEFRVNGTLGNMPEFKNAFNCSETDKMIRTGEKQAKIW